MTNCANFQPAVTSTFAKEVKKNLEVRSFWLFNLPNDLKIQIWPRPPNIIWGCPIFLILYFFSVTTPSSSKMTFKIFFEHFCFSGFSKTLPTIKTLSNPAADLLNRVNSCFQQAHPPTPRPSFPHPERKVCLAFDVRRRREGRNVHCFFVLFAGKREEDAIRIQK